MPRIALPATLFAALMLLSACDMLGGALGIESPEKVAASRDAEGKAIGGACRHAGRAIEDCYTMNKKADKAAMFAGWRDMNDYMRENKIEPVAPQMDAPTATADSAAAADNASAADDTAAPRAKAGKASGARAAKAHDS